MKLQTQIVSKEAKNQIDYHSRILLLGSCFSQNIGKKFEYYKFQSVQNPLGIIFHPKAIETLILRTLQQKQYTDDELFFWNERWHSFDAHSDISAVGRKDLLQKLNDGLEKTRQQLIKATHIFITMGTAWIYRHNTTGKIVANCHKVPQDEFTKSLLTITEISESLKRIIDAIQAVNTNAQMIFTISPVRHLKDGFVENQRSKANLISAMHDTLSSPSFEEGRGEVYFPSYEIMMDELRDYRFYATDMVHPNQLAIDYIWDKLSRAWIAKKAYPTMEAVNVVQKGLLHRPFNPDSNAHLDFIRSLQEKIAYLKDRHPFMDF